MPPPSPPRMFAPGLAMRKPKVDPYDPQNRLAQKQEYTFLRERQDAEVRGAWTAIDPDDGGIRLWDKRHHAEVAERKQARAEGRAASVASRMRSDPWSGWASSTPSDISDIQSVKSESTSAVVVDPRLENPDLDIDPEVRARFLGVQEDVFREDRKPLSAFEQRNNLSYNASAPVNVIIGGEMVRRMIPKVDKRGELRDRHGNYLDGIDRGLMKKHLEEDRKRKIEMRDEQMEIATSERRAWMALTPEEREQRLQKTQRNQDLVALLGAGVDDSCDADLYSYDTIPDVYLRKVRPESIARWTASNTSRASSVSDDIRSVQSERPVYPAASNTPRTNNDFEDDESYIPLQDDKSLFCSPPGSPIASRHPDNYYSSGKRPSSLLSSRSSAAFESPRSNPLTAASPLVPSGGTSVYSTRSDSTIRARGAPTPSTLHGSVAGSTRSTFDKGLELAPLQDIGIRRADYDNEAPASGIAREKYDRTREFSTRRGRIVAVRLHEPVKYGSSAIAQRLFGGVIQEIQYFPEDRTAIVVFVYPYEASGFLRHIRRAKDNNSHAYRQLQLDAEWYGGHEKEAIYPPQKFVLAAVVGENASRVLFVKGIRVTPAELAHDLKIRFYDKILVKVAVVTPRQRYLQARDGNMGIIEFASIRDAMEAREIFDEKKVTSYEHCSVGFYTDSCERAGPAGKEPWCDCCNCNGGRY